MFRKPTFNSLCNPFGSPFRGQKPSLPLKMEFFSTSPSLLQGELHILTKPSLLRKEGCNRPTRCSEPLRSKVGGPSKVFAILCGMRPPYLSISQQLLANRITDAS